MDRILLIKRKGTNLRYFSIVNQNNMLIGPEKEKNSCVLARYKRKHIIMEKETIISCSLIFIKAYSRNGSAYCILSNAEIYLEHTHTACVHPHTCLPTLHTHTHTHTHRETCVLPKGFEANPFHSNTNIRHSNTRSTPLKLIYIISSIYKSKIMCFEYFLPIH